MGDPKRISRKYSTPSHPWQKERIDEEKELIREYGMKNKKEIWRMSSKLRNFKRQVKNLVPRRDVQAEVEERQLMDKVRSLGLLSAEGTLEDVLGLTMHDICERRLQTLVYKRMLARSMSQSRQFITHEHIMVSGAKITSPSYLVTKDEESTISFAENSAFKDEKHPERFSMGGDDLEDNPIIKKKRMAEEKKKKSSKEEVEEVLPKEDVEKIKEAEKTDKKDKKESKKKPESTPGDKK